MAAAPPPTTVAFLGPPSSFTHQAALAAFAPAKHAFLSQTTIAGSFRAPRPPCASR